MFDRPTVKKTRDKIQAVLDILSKELGCQIKVGRASFARDGSNCTFKVECAIMSADGTVETKEVTAFRKMASLYGLSPNDLGKVFTNAGEKFTISGLKPKANKYPILATRSDGKGFKFPVDMVKLALAAAAA